MLNKIRLMPFYEADGAGAGAGAEDNGGENGAEKKTLKDLLDASPELMSEYQKDIDRRINQAVQTATQKERERHKLIEDKQRDEFERVSKMTQEEKDAYYKMKAEKEAAAHEANLTRRELKLDAREALAEKHLPSAFIDLLDYSNKEACMKSISTLEEAFRGAVQTGVDSKLKGGKPPKDAGTEGESKGMSEKDKIREQVRKAARLK